jgi:hypothetical protein
VKSSPVVDDVDETRKVEAEVVEIALQGPEE